MLMPLSYFFQHEAGYFAFRLGRSRDAHALHFMLTARARRVARSAREIVALVVFWFLAEINLREY